MKKSDLKIIDSYRMAPDAWGNESAVMIDEDMAVKAVSECLGCSKSECDPDNYENLTPEWVELAVDGIGNHYVVYSGKNEGRYQPCEKFDAAGISGMLLTLGCCEIFDDEEEN